VGLWIDTPGNFKGTLESVPATEDDRKFAADYVQRIQRLTTQAADDGRLDAEVHFGADGSTKVLTLIGRGALASETDRATFERYLRGNGLRYEEREAPGKPHVAVEKIVPIVLTVYYTRPYVWLGRGIVIGSALLFMFLIYLAWKRRSAAGGNA
jgi:hypothetical protein